MRMTDGDRDKGCGYLARTEETETQVLKRPQDRGGNWGLAGWGRASWTEGPGGAGGKEESSRATRMEG